MDSSAFSSFGANYNYRYVYFSKTTHHISTVVAYRDSENAGERGATRLRCLSALFVNVTSMDSDAERTLDNSTVVVQTSVASGRKKQTYQKTRKLDSR